MKCAFLIRGNQGYGHDQVKGITVGELIEKLQELCDMADMGGGVRGG